MGMWNKMEKHKIVIICIMWLSSAISCFSGGFFVPLTLALGAVYLTHHFFKFKI